MFSRVFPAEKDNIPNCDINNHGFTSFYELSLPILQNVVIGNNENTVGQDGSSG